MSTGSHLIVPVNSGFIVTYCHYDGYPEYMLGALSNCDPAAVIEAGEIRAVNADGSLDVFDNARCHQHVRSLDDVEGLMMYRYIWRDGEWSQLTGDQLQEMINDELDAVGAMMGRNE